MTITVAAVAGLIIGLMVGAVIAGLALMERPRRWMVMAIRNIHLPRLVSIIICGVALGAYLLYRPSRSDLSQEELDRIEEIINQMPVPQCLNMVREHDNYALFRDNKQRIADWCHDNIGLFRIPEPPPKTEMTQAEFDEMFMCIGRGRVENSPPEPHRTIEDVFDTVSASNSANA